MKGKRKRKRKQNNVKPVVVSSQPDEPIQEQEISESPKADSKNKWWKLGRNKYVYKPPDSMLSVLGFFVGILVLVVYFMQWESMQQTMRVDQRAWMSITEQAPVSVQKGQSPSVTLFVTNTGKTAARDVRGSFYVEVVAEDSSPHFETDVPHGYTFTGVATPNKESDPIPVQRYKPTPKDPHIGDPFPITDEEWAKLTDGRAWVAIHGIVYYKDMFRRQHWIRFCWWKGFRTDVSYSSANCIKYNDIDNNN